MNKIKIFKSNPKKNTKKLMKGIGKYKLYHIRIGYLT